MFIFHVFVFSVGCYRLYRGKISKLSKQVVNQCYNVKSDHRSVDTHEKLFFSKAAVRLASFDTGISN